MLEFIKNARDWYQIKTVPFSRWNVQNSKKDKRPEMDQYFFMSFLRAKFFSAIDFLAFFADGDEKYEKREKRLINSSCKEGKMNMINQKEI